MREGGIVMVHTRMSALGRVLAGAEGVVRGLLQAVGPDGTVMAYAGWEEHTYDDPAAVWDPRISEAVREHGRIPERIRTWPGAVRSDHPEASMVALGARAEWLCEIHEDGYGERSPLARLVEAGGQVLMLGAPLETITLLHHAEAIADVAVKRMVTYRIGDREYTDIETEQGAFEYGPGPDAFEVIAREALAVGIGTSDGVSHLFPAPELTRFAVAWMEERFG